MKYKELLMIFQTILASQKRSLINSKYSFKSICEAKIRKVLKNVPSDKATAKGIPFNTLKGNNFYFSKIAQNLLMKSLQEKSFYIP